ncbi:NUDIX hydrolase [Aquipuribacter sp. SD81]|uniref:NUDIX hydrolase n=1 Tax=Aquipuribacter sp. SD81 TaxID=3127703 RepID=UPI00301979F9
MSESEATALRLPRDADGTARRWLDAGAPAGPAPAVAASVCVLRDGPDGRVEVLWLTRGRGLSTWPGLLAFPGGVVETVDRSRRPGEPGPPDRLAVLARAAARECEEETGVRLRARDLRGFARWVTPEHEPRRFDTTFVVGVLPAGADPAGVAPAEGGETHEHGWAAPADLLAEVRSGPRRALPPTRAVLRDLAAAAAATVDAVTDSGAESVAGSRADAAAAAVVAGGSLVPVVPRAAWADAPPGPDGLPEVDLLLPRHAGQVP